MISSSQFFSWSFTWCLVTANIHLKSLKEYNAPIITLSSIIHNVWSVLQSHGPKAQKNQSQVSHRKDPTEEVTFLNQVACPVILCN